MRLSLLNFVFSIFEVPMELLVTHAKARRTTVSECPTPTAWWAVGGSLVVHLMLFWGVGAAAVEPVDPRPSEAVEFAAFVVSEPETTPEPASDPEPEPARLDWRSRGPKRAAMIPDEVQPETPETPPAAEAVVAPAQTLLATQAEEGGASAFHPGASGEAVASDSVGVPGGTEARGGEMDRAALGSIARDYAHRVHRLIADSARRDYPRAALRAHVEGRVLLAVTVDRDGRVTAVRVARTSGHEILDQAAIAAVQALRQVPAPPPELPWASEQTLPPLPVMYQLAI